MMIHSAHKSFTSSLEQIFPNISGNSLAEAALKLNLSKGNYISLKEGQHLLYHKLNMLYSVFQMSPWSSLVEIKNTYCLAEVKLINL